MKGLVVVALFCVSVHLVHSQASIAGEKRLVNELLTNYTEYGLYGRPVNSASETVKVHVGLTVINAVVKQRFSDSVLLHVQGWLVMNWMDAYLKWDSHVYGGIKDVRLPASGIWKPDIRLYNSFSPRMNLADVLVKVESNGNVTWVPPFTFELLVTTDRKSENIHAIFKLGSWTYDGFKMDLEKISPETDTSEWVSSQYTVIGKNVRKNVKYYPCCEEPYPDLTYTLKLQPIKNYNIAS